MNSFATCFASGLKTKVIKLVQNEMDPEAAGGQTNKAWLAPYPHILLFPFRMALLYSSHYGVGEKHRPLEYKTSFSPST